MHMLTLGLALLLATSPAEVAHPLDLAAVALTPEAGYRIAIFQGAAPRGWISSNPPGDQGPVLQIRAGDPPWQAWAVRRNLIAAVRDDWPKGAQIWTTCGVPGPAGQSVWLALGNDAGVRAGDWWWLRVGGQPAVRLVVQWTAAEFSAARVEPLARGAVLHGGERVALWPAPCRGALERVDSAVAHVEPGRHSTLVWIAAPPPAIDCPAEPHLDFFHDGHYLGHGTLERTDNLFWYARFVPLDTGASTTRRGPGSTSDEADREHAAYGSPQTASAAATQPSDQVSSLPAVGDEVRIRTRGDIEGRHFVARIFRLTAEGGLLNAGENDGLQPGQRITRYRISESSGALEPAGEFRVVAVQPGYSVVAPDSLLQTALAEPTTSAPAATQSTVAPPLDAAPGPAAPVAASVDAAQHSLAVGDEFRLRPPPLPPRRLGTIAEVAGETLVRVRLQPGATDPPLQTPLLVRSGANTVGVVLLLRVAGEDAQGVIVPESLAQPARPGMEVVAAPPGLPGN